MADQFNYFYNFPSQLAAFIDPVIGPFLQAQKPGLTDLWVYDLRNGGVVTIPTYWCMVLAPFPPPPGPLIEQILTNERGDFLTDELGQNLTSGSFTSSYDLATSPNLQFIVDVNLQIATGRGVIVNNLVDDNQLPNIQIVCPYGPYVTRGLLMQSDWILITGFWNDSGFWRDTATWID